ncbi:MAG: hypothetical protein RMN25_14155, partial [Anaerolineae bacterium]|nr:hypothetical protein [Thermoflexales bacterium]MDW8408913.1 hypothetical protein [Anaerolineae bacterium]
MVIYGGAITSVFPGYGRAQKVRILHALGRAATGHNEALHNLDRLPTRIFPAQSQIVFIGPLNRDDTALLTRMRARGYAVLVVSPDPIRFEAGRMAASQLEIDPAVQNMAVRMLEVERRLVLRRLRQAGVHVLDWDVTQPLDRSLDTGRQRRH